MTEIAIFAGGCFWCVEAVFQSLQGVETIESGYLGGHVDHPNYRQVCSGTTGHAEAIRIGFDPARITYDDLLDIFFATHDPTQLNRQGNDIGTQYRSAIFPLSPAQEAAAQAAIKRAAQDWPAPGREKTQTQRRRIQPMAPATSSRQISSVVKSAMQTQPAQAQAEGVHMAVLCNAATGWLLWHWATTSRAQPSHRPHWVATPSSNWISSKPMPARAWRAISRSETRRQTQTIMAVHGE